MQCVFICMSDSSGFLPQSSWVKLKARHIILHGLHDYLDRSAAFGGCCGENTFLLIIRLLKNDDDDHWCLSLASDHISALHVTLQHQLLWVWSVNTEIHWNRTHHWVWLFFLFFVSIQHTAVTGLFPLAADTAAECAHAWNVIVHKWVCSHHYLHSYSSQCGQPSTYL